MQFDPMSPIWLQVMRALEGEIVSGKRHPGQKLPGVRDLALAYAINPNTAAHVYQEMEKAGLCETRRGMGTFVTQNAQRIEALRRETARQAVQRFLRRMEGLGVSRREAARIILEEVQE